MATFSKSSFKTLNYNSFRPHYPPSFYKILSEYVQKGQNQHQLPVNKAIDLGCGTGVATYPLLNFVCDVIGLDLSPPMIETANSLIQQRLKDMGLDSKDPKIAFKVGSAESFVNDQESVESGSIDLITAAQCIHWFQDYDSFFQSAAKLLKRGGTLAYFYYIDPMIIDFTGPSKGDKEEILEKAYEIYLKFAYNDPNLIGPHWEQPGRDILKHFCEEVNSHIPQDQFTDVTINTYRASPKNPRAEESKDLDLKKLSISLHDYLAYFETYSGFHNYKEKSGNAGLIQTDFVKELVEATGWDLEKTAVDLVKTNRFINNQYPQNSITFPKPISSIRESTVYYAIGHPDDEVMFFSPTILELSKPKYNNTIKLICFSRGDAVGESMGPIRVKELYKSAGILGIDHNDVTVLNYKDGMNESWPVEDIQESLKSIINFKSKDHAQVIITFDEFGVSHHPNHIALYHGAKAFIKNSLKNNVKLYKLKSLGFLEKYSFTFLTNIELFVDYVSTLIQKFVPVNITISFFEPKNSSTSIQIYSDLNMLACSYAAMGYGHYSQMVWFRYGWLMLSRYLTYNQLIEVIS
ncbi:hypothetical protein KGF57_002779 [Candida theae]|uniref:N-acetylglucosaminylphosphatidylinositol deacetylase n=1 Tax=Candida theae TaxID=1198502 RepID=A0AAD5BEL9_9ASCO|nr:uncharacterized protein KGF57_002779 [Candida theae]KAI5957971.1 hypothetical protein KGF57_002779 [Candida theae]